MKIRKIGSTTLLLFIALIGGQAIANPITGLSYTSSPSSWVGGGETVTVTPAGGFDFIASTNFDNGVSFAVNDFASNPDFGSTRWWYLDFAAPSGQPLQAGHYANATRFPFQDWNNAGLSFVGNGRGDNELSGSFDVLEATYSGDGDILSFAANFTQYDENFRDWWNQGSIRFNSDIPLNAVPEPSTAFLFGVGLLGLALGITRKTNSRPIDSPAMAIFNVS